MYVVIRFEYCWWYLLSVTALITGRVKHSVVIVVVMIYCA